MDPGHRGMRARAAMLLASLLVCTLHPVVAGSVELTDLKGFERLFGRYGPSGDCAKQPRISVDTRGFTFETGGKPELVTNAEYAASYGAADYQGKSIWFFPFRLADGYSILMTFNDDEVDGRLTIAAHDEGYPGGPPLSPRNAALVKGSPYQKCK